MPPSLPRLLAVLAACVAAEAPLRTVERSELQLHSSYDMAAARAWRRPAGVSFELEGASREEGGSVRVAGWLSNHSAAPELVVVFPVGPLGLVVQPAPGSATRRPPGPGEPPRVPPVPPPPELLTLPAHSRVRVEAMLDPAEWSWNSAVARELEWSFQFWDEPKPRGRLPMP